MKLKLNGRALSTTITLTSGANTKGTKIGIKNGAVAATVLQNSATVLSWVLLFHDNSQVP